MIRDPIRRRFGKGAARLRVGLPAEAERLSALSRSPIRYERRLILVPLATAALIAWLLATSPILRPPSAPERDDAIQVVLETPVVPEAIPPLEPPRSAPRREAPRQSPAPSAAPARSLADRRPLPSMRPPDVPTKRTPDPAPFDPSTLTTRAPRVAAAGILPGSAAAAPRAATPPGAYAAPSAMPAGLANAARAPIAAAELPASSADATAALARAAQGARPGIGATAAGPSTDLVAAAHAGDRDRGAQLAALERETRGARQRAAGTASDGPRPDVSARGASDPRPALAAHGASASSGTALDGWQEVPLDELPDCSPPGRQDLLKKRILLAAALQQECSHPDGSYRFVESRSLGAFLMWSRPNPDRRAGQPRDRDACDVLERALACLGDRSSQESSP